MKKTLKRLGLVVLVSAYFNCKGTYEPEEQSNTSPYASFKQSVSEIYSGEGIKFDASRSYDREGEIVSYKWDFDDGYSGSGKITSHVYNAIGEFYPSLTVKDDEGAKSSTSGYVRVRSKRGISF